MDIATAEKVFKGYREGLLRKPDRSLSSLRPDFNSLFLQILWNGFPLAERARFRRSWRHSSRGLTAARDGRTEEACRSFQESREVLEGSGLSGRCRLLGLSMLESAQAYLDHREGRFEEARKRTLQAMDADLALESDSVFNLLELHRVQGANNLMRIDLRFGAPENGFVLAGSILAYLESHVSSLPVHRSWRLDALLATPRSLRRAMLVQVANEVALGLAWWPGHDAWSAFYDHYGPETDLKAQESLHPRIRKWARLREAFVQQDWDLYLPLLIEFLPAGVEDVNPIWYSCVIDFLGFCCLMDSRVARHVHSGILRDAVRWPGLPRAFRQCLGLNPEPAQGTAGAQPSPVGAFLARD